MTVSAIGKFPVNRSQVSLDGHTRRGFGGNKTKICRKLPFHAFELSSGLLPYAIMVLIVITSAKLPDTNPLLLFLYHLG